MGDLSRGQKERDSMLKDFLRDRDRGESRGKSRAQIAAKRAFRLTARTLVAAIKELQNKFFGPNKRCAWQLEPSQKIVSVPIGKPFAMRGLDRHFFGGAVRSALSPECAASGRPPTILNLWVHALAQYGCRIVIQENEGPDLLCDGRVHQLVVDKPIE